MRAAATPTRPPCCCPRAWPPWRARSRRRAGWWSRASSRCGPTPGRADGVAALKALRPYLAKGDFAPGSWGQANVDALAGLVDVTVSKVAYSAFFNTQLDWVLRRAGIDTVAVCGIVTNGGVASTVRDAHMRDYRTLVLGDGCAAFGEERHNTSLADMRNVAEVTACQPFIDSIA
jgi:ureidoacrylate peracid hydrolase